MRTLLYTGHDATYKPLADITVPRMAEYAERRGMDFTCYSEPLIDVPHGIYWTGVCGALKAFREGYDSVMYLDVDQLITNYNSVWPPMAGAVHISRDWGNDAESLEQFSACGFISYYGPESLLYFNSVLNLEPEFRDKPFPEQAPMQHVHEKFMREAKQRLVTVWPRRVFNCVPDEVSPGNVPEPWAPGDFAAHITMVDLNRRIEIAKEILSKL